LSPGFKSAIAADDQFDIPGLVAHDTCLATAAYHHVW
jgi:hypothetical protein